MIEIPQGYSVKDETSNSSSQNEIPSEVIKPIRDGSHLDFDSFNPYVISKEEFDRVPGEIQEFALKHLFRTRIKAESASSDESITQHEKEALAQRAQYAEVAISRLRPDFEIQTPISAYEAQLTDAIDRIISNAQDNDNSANSSTYNFIKTFIPRPVPVRNSEGAFDQERYVGLLRESDSDLKSLLDEEKRRRDEFPDSLFYPHVEIGTYHPGRRYRWLLEKQVKIEIEEERLGPQRAAELVEMKEAYEYALSRMNADQVAKIGPDLKVIQPEQAA